MGNTNVFLGDSLIEGALPLDASTRWTTVYSTAVGKVQDNRGIGGTTMQSGVGGRTTFDINNVPVYDSATHNLIFIAYGVNDSVFGGTSSAYGTATSTAVDGIIAKGWPSQSIVLVWSWYSGGSDATHSTWRNVLHNVAVVKSTLYLDFSAPIIADPNKASYNADGIHPNVAGAQKFAALAQTNIENYIATITASKGSILNIILNMNQYI